MGCWGEWRPVVTMVAVDVTFAVMNILCKKAIDDGMNRLVLITLRQLVAMLFMAPIAYFRERKTRPKLTAEILVYIFFSALLGAALTQYLFFLGLQYTSATFACAFLNMTPVFTFLIALPLRLERLDLKAKAGIAKVIGTLVCLFGAMLLTLYQGVALTNTSTHELQAQHQATSTPPADPSTKKWIFGSIALLAACFCWSLWFLIQSIIGKKYPALYSSTALIFFFSFLQAGTMSLATEQGISSWVLRSKVEIVTVLFAGVMGSGLGFLGMSWCVEKRGPLFTAAFTPLVQIIVAGIDVTILHERLYLGSVLGSVLVIVGLYFLLWGKSKEVRTCAVKATEENIEPQVQLQNV
ncbi:WAT1-related protein At3g30340-like [Typha latifolia]|uniref:WAT1-related protein At3g30340-like n=1 Tax=Typha latifolia TaxID=4733 RepID=UPI003C2C8B46